MTRWFFIPAFGALLLLGACADGGVGQTQLSQADVSKQAALNACKAEAYTQRPLPRGDAEFTLPGEPHGRNAYWYEGVNRQIDDCLAAKSAAPAS